MTKSEFFWLLTGAGIAVALYIVPIAILKEWG
jgi:hypothetical protein